MTSAPSTAADSTRKAIRKGYSSLRVAIESISRSMLVNGFRDRPRSWEGDRCPICMIDYSAGEEVSIMHCRHPYHAKSMLRLYASMNPTFRCVVCRERPLDDKTMVRVCEDIYPDEDPDNGDVELGTDCILEPMNAMPSEQHEVLPQTHSMIFGVLVARAAGRDISSDAANLLLMRFGQPMMAFIYLRLNLEVELDGEPLPPEICAAGHRRLGRQACFGQRSAPLQQALESEVKSASC